MRIIILVLVIFLASCTTVRQTVKPVENYTYKEICVIDNPKVAQKNFLKAYKTALEKKGFVVKILDEGTNILHCDNTSTYTANWSWDLALYLTYVKLKVYEKGEVSGEAVYKLVRGGGFSKFINAEEKINELVGQLFPSPNQQTASGAHVDNYELSKSDIKSLFNDKTVEGVNLKRDYDFKRYYSPDGTIYEKSYSHGDRKGKWYASYEGLCWQWHNSMGEARCASVEKSGSKYLRYNRKGTKVREEYNLFIAGNSLNGNVEVKTIQDKAE